MICFEKGLQIAEECEFKHMKVLFLSNMGVAYKNMRELRKSNRSKSLKRTRPWTRGKLS